MGHSRARGGYVSAKGATDLGSGRCLPPLSTANALRLRTGRPAAWTTPATIPPNRAATAPSPAARALDAIPSSRYSLPMASPSRRPLLLQAAHTIARRDGAEAVTLDAVAAEAGVSKSVQR